MSAHMTQAEAKAASDTFPLETQIAEAARELKMRETNYPAWVREGRLRPAEAERQLALQRAILGTLRLHAGPPPQASILDQFESQAAAARR
jgi:hypothetical protein